MDRQNKDMPLEVLQAKAAFDAEFAKIRSKMLAHRERYQGTKYEECPPLLEEQMRFSIRGSLLDRERQRLKDEYGECPRRWAYYVAWWKEQKKEEGS